MNPRWYFSPNFSINRGMPIVRNTYFNPTFNDNLFKKIGRTFSSINWKNLLSNANKTLNVVNQTIPLIRQTGPIINNMKSMVNLAKAFRKETNNNTQVNNNYVPEDNKTIHNTKQNNPIFFI